MTGPLPSPILRTPPRVAVIGGGIAGCSTAYFLARGGAKVTLFERDFVGSKASGVNFGGLRRHGRDPSELPLSLRSHRIWRQFRELFGRDCDAGFSGHLKLAKTDAEMQVLVDWAAVGKAHGLTVDLFTTAQLVKAHPEIGPGFAGASFCHGDGFANPRLAVPTIARAAHRHGVIMREETTVQGFAQSGGGWRIRLTDGEEVAADFVVNATGAWANHLACLPVGPKAVAPEIFVTEPTDRVRLRPVFGVVGGAIYMRQTSRGNVIFGGGYGEVSADAWRSRPGEAVLNTVPTLLTQLIPTLAGVPILRCWTGVEAHMPDGLPVIGPVPNHDRALNIWGFSGHGFQLGPAAGQTIAELILTDNAAPDIGAFSASRF